MIKISTEEIRIELSLFIYPYLQYSIAIFKSNALEVIAQHAFRLTSLSFDLISSTICCKIPEALSFYHENINFYDLFSNN